MAEIMGSLLGWEGKDITMIKPRNSIKVNTSKMGANWQHRSLSCEERGHVVYACPKRRVNLPEVANEEGLTRGKVSCRWLCTGRCWCSIGARRVLSSKKSLATLRVRKDWRRHDFFRTRAFSGGKMCNLILDGGTSKNITLKQAIENLKLTTKKHPTL